MNKSYWGIKAAERLIKELYKHNDTFIRASETYGKDEQILHSVEELTELAGALLKARKRNFNESSTDEVIQEVADVLIQIPIILENLGITEAVRSTIAVKMLKAEKRITATLDERSKEKNS